MPYIFKYKERVVNFTDNEINIIGGSLYSINKRESEIKVHHNDYKTMKRYFTIGGRFMIINYTLCRCQKY